jgi:RNA polymerase sigma-70 factor (ECF subfamily)
LSRVTKHCSSLNCLLDDKTIFDFIEIKTEIPEIMHAIEKLPLATRTVFMMYTMDGYKHKEIAEVMKISENTSKAHFHQAKIKLKEILKMSDPLRIAISILLVITYFK